ncbi:hypothetical protein KV113_10090, partial [Mycolicibacter sp. MYC340]|nr:hypothetical protein [Mycolicibacter sp. MYC340]
MPAGLTTPPAGGAATIGCCDVNGASGCCDICEIGAIPPDDPIPEAKPDWKPAPASASGDGIDPNDDPPAEAGDVPADPRPELNELGFKADDMPEPIPEPSPPG